MAKDEEFQYYKDEIKRKTALLNEYAETRNKFEKARVTEADVKNQIDLDAQIKNYKEKEEGIVQEINNLREEDEKIKRISDISLDRDDLKDVKTTIIEDIDEKEPVEPNLSEVQRVFGSRSSEITPLTDEDKFIKLKTSFQQGNDIENTLIYVATFFEGLSPYEFNQVISILLKDKKTIVSVEKDILTDQGEVKTLKENEQKNVLDIWTESLGKPDEYLHKCYLRSVETKGTRVIDFVPSALRSSMKSYLKDHQPLYVDNLLELAQSFMFHPSVEVAKGGLGILSEAMITHPNIYNEEWMIYHLIEKLITREKINIDSGLHLFEQILNHLNQLEILKREKFIFERISGLLYFMLENKVLRPIVHRFLDKLLMQHKHYKVVIAVIENLRHVKEFDDLYWIKRLFDNSNEEQTIVKAYKLLYGKLKSSGFQVHENLSELYSWLPRPELTPDRYSPSSKAALSILVDYCSDTISSISEQDYGRYPSRYLLFRAFREGDVGKKFHKIFNWLFHVTGDGTLAISSILNSDTDTMGLIGSFIAEWYAILAGLEGEPSKENDFAIESMLEQVARCTTKEQHKELINFWINFSDYYLYKINLLPKLPKNEDKLRMRENKRRLTKRRKLVRSLNKDFRAIQKAAI